MADIREISSTPQSFQNLMTIVKEGVMSTINCHNIGRIVEFDAQTQTASVEMLQIKQFGGNNIPPSILTQVPVIIYGTANANITLPDPTGSICLILFMDRNMDNFKLSGTNFLARTSRMHDFTDCVALTTFSSLANPIQNYEDNAISMRYETIINEIKYFSKINNYGNYIQLTSNTSNENEVDTGILNINPIGTALQVIKSQGEDVSSSSITMTSVLIQEQTTQGGVIGIDDKIKIENTDKNLLNLMKSLLSACESIVTQSGGGLNPASKQQFTDLKTEFEGLLK